MRRAGQQDPARVDRGGGEGRRREPEDDVEFAVEDERRARVGGQARDEPLTDEGPQGLRTALRPEPAGDDRLGDLRLGSGRGRTRR